MTDDSPSPFITLRSGFHFHSSPNLSQHHQQKYSNFLSLRIVIKLIDISPEKRKCHFSHFLFASSSIMSHVNATSFHFFRPMARLLVCSIKKQLKNNLTVWVHRNHLIHLALNRCLPKSPMARGVGRHKKYPKKQRSEPNVTHFSLLLSPASCCCMSNSQKKQKL